jgi:ribosomal protein S12 methylthiotransferase accessory factor
MDVSSGEGAAEKAFRRGTHRTAPPDETIARLQPLLAAFGVTRVANLTGLDRIGVPVVMVCRPNARSSAVFHGKGVDLACAKASGLMEAVETWHAEQIRLPLRYGSVVDVGGWLPLADVDAIPRSAAGRFRPDLPMLWIEGRDLIGGGSVWLPYECVHMNATVPEPPGSGCFECSTNGLASGNHLLEAVSHALCEVIERDATSLWRRGGLQMQDQMRLDLATVQDELCRAVIDQLSAAELEVAVWDVTTDVGVPAFQCLLADRTGEIDHLGQGAGCHPVREVALLRALTEAVQVRTTYIVGSREDISPADYLPATLQARLRSAERLMRPVARMRRFEETPRTWFEDFETEVAWLLERLAAAGVGQALMVDLTRPEFGIPVVRAVIPGLEGSDHHAGYVPGRRARAVAEGRR